MTGPRGHHPDPLANGWAPDEIRRDDPRRHCPVCGGPMDPWLIEHGYVAHPGCEGEGDEP